MPAQSGGPADFDRVHDAQLGAWQTMAVPVGGSVAAEDVGHFQGRAGHRSGRFRSTLGLAIAFLGKRPGNRSSGWIGWCGIVVS
jgi:hypothetical protein